MPFSSVPAKKSALITLAAWLLAAIVAFIITAAYLTSHIEAKNAYIASLTIRDIDYTAASVASVASSSEIDESIDCSGRSKRLLRKHVFAHPGISDIGVYGEGGVRCSAMVGSFATAIEDPPEQFIVERTGGKFWAKRSLSDDVLSEPAMAYRRANLLFIMNPLHIHQYPPEKSSWEITYDGETSRFADGQPGLKDALERGDLTFSGVTSLVCSDNHPYCVTIHTPWSAIVAMNLDALLIAMFGLGLLAFALSTIGHRYVERCSTPAVRVKSALSRKAFHCHYQPIVDIQANSVIGCEVLARLEDAYGPLSPAEFIPAINTSGSMQRFTETLFDRAYMDISKIAWTQKNPFKFSFNIFPENLNMRTVAFFETHPALADKRIQVCLEVTEDSSVSEEKYETIISRLNALGIEVSVDDFGTGYGNLKRIEIPGLKYLKIDKSLINNLTAENVKDSLTSFIPMLAERTGLEMIAEGIETPENVDAIKVLGVRYAQGFYFGRPQPIEGFLGTINESVLLANRQPEVIPFKQVTS